MLRLFPCIIQLHQYLNNYASETYTFLNATKLLLPRFRIRNSEMYLFFLFIRGGGGYEVYFQKDCLGFLRRVPDAVC